MTKNLPDALSTWVREALADVIDGNPCKMISCTHKEGSKDVEVYSIQITPDKIWEPADVAKLLRHKAESHVADIPGTQLFYVYAFYGDSGEPGQRRSFRVNNSDTDFGYGVTEPPTAQGGAMQAMRHGEVAFQFSFKHTQYLLEGQFRMVDMLTRQVATLMKENHDALSIAKETILERANLDRERILEEAKKQERLELIKLLPPLVNRVMGRDVFPQSTADTKLIEAFLGEVDGSMLEKLAAFLPPNIMAMIAERGAKMYEEKNRAIKTAEKALTNGNGKSESDGEDILS